jgi:hypothetical protein
VVFVSWNRRHDSHDATPVWFRPDGDSALLLVSTKQCELIMARDRPPEKESSDTSIDEYFEKLVNLCPFGFNRTRKGLGRDIVIVSQS